MWYLCSVMPELPEVETIVRQLRPEIGEKIIADVWSERERTLADRSLDDFRRAVIGSRIKEVVRRAKYCILRFDDGRCIAIHLKMSGHLKVIPPHSEYDPRFIRAWLAFTDGAKLLFSDIRRFGRMYLIEDYKTWQSKMGIEPLNQVDFTLENLTKIFVNRKTPVKPTLLNQELIAGIGNIYADEILWASKIHPARPANSLSQSEIWELYQHAPWILRTAIEANGSTLRNYRDLHGLEGGYMDMVNCYGRTGIACKRNDGGIIQRTILRTRATHFCPVCQK